MPSKVNSYSHLYIKKEAAPLISHCVGRGAHHLYIATSDELSRLLKLLRSCLNWTKEEMASRLGMETISYAQIEYRNVGIRYNLICI